jgi:3-methylcrotonyl-CoA carboxylase alpha subunit
VRGSGIGDQGSGEVTEKTDTEIVPLGDGRFQIVTSGRRTIAYAVRSGGDTWVFLDGRTYVVHEPATAGRRGGRADDDVALAAPMPATVVAVNVTAGQSVQRGDVLITLEAMKMELAVKAPRDATVRSVSCRAGELVQPGVPLLELE